MALTSYRPVRIGFLVREGSINDLVTTAGINTLLCGGVYNPIIPVFANTRFSERLVSLFNVDILYAVSHTPQIDEFIGKYSYLRSPLFHNEDLFTAHYETQKMQLVYLDCINLIEHYWESDFRHRPKRYKSRCALISWDDQDPLKAFLSVSFGYFPNRYDLHEDFARAFLKGLRSKSVFLTADTPLTADIARAIYPIRFTATDLAVYGGNFRNNALYVGDADSFTDLFLFWNLRAAGLAIQFLPKGQVQRCEQFIRAHLARLDKVPNRPAHIEDMITVYYHRDNFWEAAPNQEVVEIAKGFQPTKQFVFSGCDELSWNGLNIKAADIDFGSDHASLSSMDKSFERYAITISSQEKPPAVTNARTRGGFRGQNLILSVHPTGLGHPSHTLKLPYIPKLTEFYGRQIVFDPRKLRVAKERLGLFLSAGDNQVTLYPLNCQKLVLEVFNYVGISAEISQAGRIALRIIEKLSEMFGTGAVFRIRGVRDLLQRLKKDEAIERGEATIRIWANGQFQEHKSRWDDPQAVFNYLLRKDVFRAGLQFPCDHCRLESWLSLKEIDDLWICPYCGNEHRTSLHLKKYGNWKFRKSGLFAKDNNQEGAVPVILTLLKLSETLSDTIASQEFVHTTSLNLTFDSKSCETDFCVMQYERLDDRGRAIEIGIGECKSEGGAITEQDVENLIATRERFRDTGIECFLIFSKTADSFADEEMDLFKQLANQQIPCVLLLNRELERDPLADLREKDLPREYPRTLRDMSINSYHRYLKPSQP